MPTVPKAQRPDARDMSDVFNTILPPEQEQAYQEWARKIGHENDTYDYDLRGAYRDGGSQAENGHFPDTYKKPNHPTFSNESIYDGQGGMAGGRWAEMPDGKPTFTPGPANLHWRKPEELQQYFQEAEPDVMLTMRAPRPPRPTQTKRIPRR